MVPPNVYGGESPFVYHLQVPVELVLYGELECNCSKSGRRVHIIDERKRLVIDYPFFVNPATFFLGGGPALAAAKAAALRVKVAVAIARVTDGLITADAFIQEYAPYLRVGLEALWDSADLICEGKYNPAQLWDRVPVQLPQGIYPGNMA